MSRKRSKQTRSQPTQRSAPPPPKENDRQKGWWKKLAWGYSRIVQHGITVPLLLVAIGVLGERWLTELGEKNTAIARAERAEERVGNQNKELENLRKKNEDLERLEPLLKLYGYGTRAKLVTNYDLKKEVGAQIALGKCPQTPCLIFKIEGIDTPPTGIDVATITFRGVWDGATLLSPKAFAFGLPLKKGCRATLKMSQYDVDLVIEDDRYSNVKAGIGISPASSSQGGFSTVGPVCP